MQNTDTEPKKVKCECCGKTIAMENKGVIEIKCTGKSNGKKCGHVNQIKQN